MKLVIDMDDEVTTRVLKGDKYWSETWWKNFIVSKNAEELVSGFFTSAGAGKGFIVRGVTLITDIGAEETKKE